jgi:hypothetical protein
MIAFRLSDVGLLVAGALLLLLGRRLFWLFVGLTGFAAGLVLAQRWLADQPEWYSLLIALGIGLLGALLALFLQRLAIGVAGFLAGAVIGSTLASTFAGDAATAMWVGIAIGGILGAVLLSVFFDIGLIGLSAFVGATMVVEALHLTREIGIVVTIVLFILGLAFQSFSGRKPAETT